MDDRLFGEDLLIVTTTTGRGILRRVAVLIVVNAIAVGINLIAIFSPETNAREVFLGLILADVLALGLSLFIVAIDSRGTWTLDKLGIEHHRPIRPAAWLQWSDVTRILWYDALIALEGKGTRIRVRLDLLPKHEREQVKAWVESRLQEPFGLGPSPLSLDRRGRTRRHLQRTAFGALMATMFFGIFIALMIFPFQSEANRSVAILIWTPLGSIACLAPLGFMVGVQNALIDPHYPWKVRLFVTYSTPKPPNFEQDLA